jgi:hypothetical protein
VHYSATLLLCCTAALLHCYTGAQVNSSTHCYTATLQHSNAPEDQEVLPAQPSNGFNPLQVPRSLLHADYVLVAANQLDRFGLHVNPCAPWAVVEDHRKCYVVGQVKEVL